ncbi:DUF3089 domain-containing protein [Altericroceibacterium endophyticum]|uniref:DUF3089 domain-containing protein n=1 Tax=Altericroceibacterium endophyticum TaxID=1808508 RepID=A0A6I4T9G2_9SPHN|nr:DUF3089 domain-containing protein [Altericroceibacterium endophyticum]MXO66922.1 DUF3089 domain-containing protein [Altericroceibacterium endophyticum]
MARKFLYVIAALIVLVIAALAALRIWSDELTEIAFVPQTDFVEQAPLETNAYADPAMWFSREGMDAGENPARWQPIERPALAVEESEADSDDEAVVAEDASAATLASPAAPAPPATFPAKSERLPFAVFFVHPTSYLDRSQWNAPLNDPESQKRARLFVHGLASPFNQASEIWAPRYRQATFGAFLTNSEEAQQAIDAAYRDVEQAFDYFLEHTDPDMPIVLAGHSQGSLHLLRLMHDRIAGTPLQQRIAAFYPVGWPISVEHDLPELGLPACDTPDQASCISTWSSFGEPAKPGRVLTIYGDSMGFDGELRGESPILCANPITGTMGGEAPPRDNLGTLFPNDQLTSGELVPGVVPARCDEQGLLLIGEGPDLGPYVLPGNNYHVYDIPLFWRNVQADVARRVKTWTQNQ